MPSGLIVPFLDPFKAGPLPSLALVIAFPHINRMVNTYLYQINISDGGVPKYPVKEVWVSSSGLRGDRQRHQSVHGGKDRALCLFSLEVIQALQQEGHGIQPGSTGENLTLSGLSWSSLEPGDQIRIGQDLQIEITSYAEPCRFNSRWFIKSNYKRISQKVHPGWSRLYARVLSEGSIQTGNRVRIEVQTTARAL